VWGNRVEVDQHHIERWREDPAGTWECMEWQGVWQPARWHPSAERKDGSGLPKGSAVSGSSNITA
jgi:hypothetical protein